MNKKKVKTTRKVSQAGWNTYLIGVTDNCFVASNPTLALSKRQWLLIHTNNHVYGNAFLWMTVPFSGVFLSLYIGDTGIPTPLTY